ncbi:MAG TPA: signal peptide peptidase SppA [Caulobacteraceae bacterium]|nr:signal peptide peptidase SppA [Caulobacteraceae bacterium]
MKQFLITVAGVFCGLALFMVAVPIALIGWAVSASKPAPVPGHSVLTLDLRDGLTDQEPQDGLAIFGTRPLSVMGIEETLHRAQSDSRVAGLLVRLPDAGMSPAAADELRLAFQRFRATGKPILAYSQGIYQEGVSTATYELGAASGDLWMQPSASFQATGLATQDLFLKRFFDRYGVVADFQQRYQYKNAVNGYLYDDYTPAHREAELSWMGSIYSTSLAAAAQDRKMAPETLRAIIEAGPYSADDAKAKGLIDNVGEVKEAEDAILKQAAADAKLVDFAQYAAQARSAPPVTGLGATPTIALIQAEGDIVTGAGGHSSPFGGGGSTIYSDDIAKAFYNAIADKDIKAIVFRVSSPGGSDTASEEILSAVRAAKAAGKPVVVSMGDYGASGGYWISSQASAIVAEPSTLTGSIGVFGGKLAIGPALGKFGVDMRGLKVGGDYSDAFGSEGPMTAAQRAAFGAWLDRIYNGFVARVADGRKLPVARVEEIAKGHVWTGAQAKQLGLVDELGGFQQAVDRAKALAHITGLARLKVFGPRVSPFEALARMFGGGVEGAQLMTEAGSLSSDPQARVLLETLREARLRDQGAMVLAPGLPVYAR